MYKTIRFASLGFVAAAGMLMTGCGPRPSNNQPKTGPIAQNAENAPSAVVPADEPAAEPSAAKTEPAAQPAAEPTSPAAEPTSPAAEPTAPAAEPMPEPAAEAKPAETTEPAASEAAAAATASAEAPAAEPAASEAASETPATEEKQVVMLGSPDLTAGIPGEGDLKMEELKAWLDDPKNHQVLEVRLPLGLDAAAAQIKGLDETPLTRAKIELGRQLYFDPRLSIDQTISCASCHDPDFGYAKPTQFGVGVKDQTGGRNSPVAYNRLFSDLQFWDGRAATLEDQATGPIANPIEMGFTHDACVACLNEIEMYRIQFEKIFGELTIEAVGKALASFERAIVTGPTPYDYHEKLRPFEKLAPEDLEDLKEDDPDTYAAYEAALAEASAHPMSDSAKRGRDLFFGKALCTNCHVGANFTDEQFHNLGVGMEAEKPDLGRFDATGEDKDKGAFKTPTIRNVVLTAPYMHDGSQKTLEEVVEWYNKGGHPNPHLSDKVKKLDLNEQEKADLVEFMKALTGEFPKVERGRLPPPN